MESEIRRAILYARFSPRPNAAECESCEAQLEDLRKYCARYKYEVVGEFQDKALSGGDDWSKRPGMFDAVAVCGRGDLFVVRAFDRLFRDTEKALIFKSMIESKGARVRSITEESACDGSPVGNLLRTIFLAVAEYQRALIRARTRAKMQQYQREGRAMSKDPPYGAKVNPQAPGRLIQDLNEIQTIETIRRLHAEGKGLTAIARALDAAGIQSRGKRWNHNTIARILRREGLRP